MMRAFPIGETKLISTEDGLDFKDPQDCILGPSSTKYVHERLGVYPGLIVISAPEGVPRNRLAVPIDLVSLGYDQGRGYYRFGIAIGFAEKVDPPPLEEWIRQAPDERQKQMIQRLVSGEKIRGRELTPYAEAFGYAYGLIAEW